MGVLEILLVIFVVCKVMGWGAIAAWSWGAVLIPLWIDLALYATILGVIGWAASKE